MSQSSLQKTSSLPILQKRKKVDNSTPIRWLSSPRHHRSKKTHLCTSLADKRAFSMPSDFLGSQTRRGGFCPESGSQILAPLRESAFYKTAQSTIEAGTPARTTDNSDPSCGMKPALPFKATHTHNVIFQLTGNRYIL